MTFFNYQKVAVRILRPLCFAMVLAGVGNVPTFAEPVGPKPGELTTVQGLQLAISAPEAKVWPGPAINLESSIKNVTDKPLSLGLAPVVRRYRMEVTTSKGEAIPLTRYGQDRYGPAEPPPSQGVDDIAPGASFDRQLELSRLYDLSKSGTYIIKVNFVLGLPPGIDPFKATAKDFITVPSNVLQITVR